MGFHKNLKWILPKLESVIFRVCIKNVTVKNTFGSHHNSHTGAGNPMLQMVEITPRSNNGNLSNSSIDYHC